ncbi:ABC transporter ATP-binding protein [uncultured Vagococcus sp.]|uniref:ABC transporter ATP-binding protein n=1 Tax=uncultured Vagococcus sp. TaxID=189676 RepID=UPI0028D3C114|nr:ABC transporter ATP-binding protein [uncultured Vagococcus sp.]
MTNYLLETHQLTKRYREQVAVNAVDLHIERGSIYGLIGRNGAGKTTLMRTISGLASPTSGTISIFGESGPKVSRYFSRIGVLIESPGLYGDMSAADNLKLKQLCIGLKGKTYVGSLLELVGLGSVRKKKVKSFSLGMKQRLGIAMALIGEPDLLILDEPLNGLDPEGMVEVRHILVKLAKEKNITIMISSHILEELEKMATTYGFIHQGVLVKEVTHEKLMSECSDYIEIQLDEPSLGCTVLEEMGIRDYQVIDQKNIQVYEQLSRSSEINLALGQANVAIRSISLSQISLEDYFLSLTGGQSHG